MAKSNETPSTPPGDDRNLVGTTEAAASTDLEEVVQQFWEKNRSLLMALAAVVLLAIVVRNGWSFYQTAKLESAREDFAMAEGDDALQAFADDNSGTGLAGVALLKIADNAYAENRFGDAVDAYDAAATELEGTVFADRIALGRAMALIKSGDASTGEAELRNLANRTDAAAAVRGEAVYHLAAVAMEADDLAGIEALAMQVDAFAPGTTWAQRVTLMRAAAEAAAGSDTEEPAEETPEISFGTP